MQQYLYIEKKYYVLAVLIASIVVGGVLLAGKSLFSQSNGQENIGEKEIAQIQRRSKVALYIDDRPVQFLNQVVNSVHSTSAPKGEKLLPDMENVENHSSIEQANILKNDFSDELVGIYTDTMFKDDSNWGEVRWANFHKRASIVRTGKDQQLRILLPKGAHGNLKSGGSAGVAFEPQDEIYQRMTVLFEPGFDFQISGKIAGIGSPQGEYTGGNVPRNGEGFSSRFIWDDREGQYGRAAIYLYHVDQREIFGDQDGLGFNWKTGVRYTMTQRIKRNTGNNKDGILQVWMSENGGMHQLVMDRNDLRWGLDAKGRADTLLVSPFHGGSGDRYAPDTDSYIQLSNFAISTEKFSDLLQ